LKYKNFVDSSIQGFSIYIDNESICQVHKTTNRVYQMLKSTLGPALLVYSQFANQSHEYQEVESL
jgi:hypothetical protein